MRSDPLRTFSRMLSPWKEKKKKRGEEVEEKKKKKKKKEEEEEEEFQCWSDCQSPFLVPLRRYRRALHRPLFASVCQDPENKE